MTRGVGWFVAWLGVVCLLWSLGVHASVHHTPPVVWDLSIGPWRHIVLTSLSVVPNPAAIRPRARPLEWFAPHCALVTAGDAGPPWWDTRGPPGACGSSSVSGQAAGYAGSFKNEQRPFLPRNFHALIGPRKNLGFCNSL